jgi:hypothetical protein
MQQSKKDKREKGRGEIVESCSPVLSMESVFFSLLNYLLTPVSIYCNTDILQQHRDWELNVNVTFIFLAWNTVSRELENFSQNGADTSKGKSVLYISIVLLDHELIF